MKSEYLGGFLNPFDEQVKNLAGLQGKVQVISQEGLHQLHIFIFVMAVVHVLYSAITVLIGLFEVKSLSPYLHVL